MSDTENCDSGVRQLLERKRFSTTIKSSIVLNCEAVFSQPDSNMSSLRELIRYLSSKKILSSKALRNFLVASLCVVFKDILPSYRIRPITEVEKHQQAKKETRKLRFFEENLLVNYRKYTEMLNYILSSSNKRTSSKVHKNLPNLKLTTADRIVALKAACQLIECHPRFNFSEDLLSSVLPYLNDPRKQVHSIVFDSLQSIFRDDLEGQWTLSTCKAMHSFCRRRAYKIRPPVALALSVVPIKDVLDSKDDGASRRDRKALSRRERKQNKLDKKHEKLMSETQAVQSKESRTKLNTLILNEILFVYFKLLKTTSNSNLLSAVLQGLSVYSNLINVEYVEGLLIVLNRIVSQKTTSLCDGLNCINTALNILSLPGSTSAVQTDPTRFYNHLYGLLGRMACVCPPTEDKNSIDATLKSLTSVYARSNTPAAQAVNEYIRKSAITSSGDSANHSVGDSTLEQVSEDRVGMDDWERLTNLMLTCLNSLLIRRRRDVSTNRVLAFVKRLAGVALITSDPSCVATILVRLIHLIRLFPRCEVLFDSETELSGAYRPEVDDPELCSPSSACLWELHVLTQHASPLVRKLASAALHWGSVAHQFGPTEAALKPHKINFTSDPEASITLDHLIQLPPSECQAELTKLELSWSESESKVVKSTSRSKRSRSEWPSEWLFEQVHQRGLDSQLLMDLSPSLAKRQKKS